MAVFNNKPILLVSCILLLTSISLSSLSGQALISPSYQTEHQRVVQISFPIKLIPLAFKKEDLALYVGSKEQLLEHQPPILGQFQLKEKELVFRPQFPLETERFYTLIIKETFQYSFPLKSQVTVAPTIQAIFPSSNQLPANLLKFYIHFSEPMQAGNSYDQIVLCKQNGDTIDAPFVVLSPELWNDDFTRLTLWIDPGRIKRSLGPNQTYGPVLHNRQRYELCIKNTWKNQNGTPLKESYCKEFRVISADRQQLNVENWQLSLPKAASQHFLEIDFKKPMDAALLQRMIQVYGPYQELLDCTFSIGEKEQTLQIKPPTAWQAKRYTLKIDSYLEDISGNNLLRPFDRDLRQSPAKTKEQDYFYLPFQPSIDDK